MKSHLEFSFQILNSGKRKSSSQYCHSRSCRVGLPDLGKTTLCTQLLYKCSSSIDQPTKERVERVMKEVSFVFKAFRMKY
jgi:translation elongation factor EF-1alpha